MKCSLEVPQGENIIRIKVRHTQEPPSIQNITFETDQGTEVEFNGKQENGELSVVDLEKDEQIVGCYGCCLSEEQSGIVGLGFVAWKPVEELQEQAADQIEERKSSKIEKPQQDEQQS